MTLTAPTYDAYDLLLMVVPGNSSTGLSLRSLLAGFSSGVSVRPAFAVSVSQRNACLRLVSVSTNWAPWDERSRRRSGVSASVPA